MLWKTDLEKQELSLLGNKCPQMKPQLQSSIIQICKARLCKPIWVPISILILKLNTIQYAAEKYFKKLNKGR